MNKRSTYRDALLSGESRVTLLSRHTLFIKHTHTQQVQRQPTSILRIKRAFFPACSYLRILHFSSSAGVCPQSYYSSQCFTDFELILQLNGKKRKEKYDRNLKLQHVTRRAAHQLLSQLMQF